MLPMLFTMIMLMVDLQINRILWFNQIKQKNLITPITMMPVVVNSMINLMTNRMNNRAISLAIQLPIQLAIQLAIQLPIQPIKLL